MKKLPKDVEQILMAFCIHEKLHYPGVKGVYLRQKPKEQLEHLHEIEQLLRQWGWDLPKPAKIEHEAKNKAV